MKLLIEELKNIGIGQKITPIENYNVEAIRPHIYKHNNPTGSLEVTVSDVAGNIIAISTPVLISDISPSAFYHGHIRFFIDVSLIAGVEYLVCIQGTDGYSFSESAYIGFCKDFDFHTYETSFSPSAGLNSPFDMEVWARSSR